MELNTLTKKPKNMFYGWWVVIAATTIGAMGGGIFVYGFSTFFLPLQQALGISRTAYSSIIGLSRIEGGIEGPLVGWLIDRIGTRRIMLVGILMFAAGFILLYWMNSLVYFILVFAGLITIGHGAGFMHSSFALANKWFVRKRSRATGIVSSAFGIGGAIIVPILGWLIATQGWRVAALASGLTTLAIGLPALLVIRNTPEEKGLLPDGARPVPLIEEEDKPNEESNPAEIPDEYSFSVREALKTRTFWILSLGFNLRMFVIGSVWTHMVPLLVWKGLDEQTAAAAIGIELVCTIPSRIFFGWLGDRYPKNRLLAICCGIETIALIIALTTTHIWQVYLFVIIWAMGYGIAPLNVAIVGEYFGRKNFATIRGVQAMSYMAGIMLGPIFSGLIYDLTNSYQWALIAGIGLYFLAGIVFLFFVRRPRLPATATGYTIS